MRIDGPLPHVVGSLLSEFVEIAVITTLMFFIASIDEVVSALWNVKESISLLSLLRHVLRYCLGSLPYVNDWHSKCNGRLFLGFLIIFHVDVAFILARHALR